MEQKPARKITKYRVVAANHYEGTYVSLPGIFDSREQAQDVLKKHFDDRTSQGMGMSGDVGGYVEKINLDLAYDPHAGKFYEENES